MSSSSTVAFFRERLYPELCPLLNVGILALSGLVVLTEVFQSEAGDFAPCENLVHRPS